MHVVIVNIHVKEDCIDNFIKETKENSKNSIMEPGISRFDFIQNLDDPARFVLIEVYKDGDAPAKHKETAHYNRWKENVAPMMAEPRIGIKYKNLYPEDIDW